MAVDDVSIKVPFHLQTASTTINAAAEAITDELHALYQQLLPLETTWMGQAHTYYDGLQQEWNTAAEGLFGPDGVLGQIARAMGVNWNNYADSEASNAGTWQH